MPVDEPPPDGPTHVWLLMEPASRFGHRLTVGVFSTAVAAEAARARAGAHLWLRRVALDRPPERK